MASTRLHERKRDREIGGRQAAAEGTSREVAAIMNTAFKRSVVIVSGNIYIGAHRWCSNGDLAASCH